MNRLLGLKNKSVSIHLVVTTATSSGNYSIELLKTKKNYISHEYRLFLLNLANNLKHSTGKQLLHTLNQLIYCNYYLEISG